MNHSSDSVRLSFMYIARLQCLLSCSKCTGLYNTYITLNAHYIQLPTVVQTQKGRLTMHCEVDLMQCSQPLFDQRIMSCTEIDPRVPYCAWLYLQVSRRHYVVSAWKKKEIRRFSALSCARSAKSARAVNPLLQFFGALLARYTSAILICSTALVT